MDFTAGRFGARTIAQGQRQHHVLDADIALHGVDQQLAGSGRQLFDIADGIEPECVAEICPVRGISDRWLRIPIRALTSVGGRLQFQGKA
jgi:hypothetical protein